MQTMKTVQFCTGFLFCIFLAIVTAFLWVDGGGRDLCQLIVESIDRVHLDFHCPRHVLKGISICKTNTSD